LLQILIYLAPESPTWLVSQSRQTEAKEVFHWLRGTGSDATNEIQGIVDKNQHRNTNIENNSLAKELLRPSFFKPFFFMTIFFFVQQFSGVNAVAFYTVTIFQQIFSVGGSSVNEYVAMGVLDVARVLMSVVACVLLRRMGRRSLAIFSATGTALSLLGLAAFLHFGSSLSPENFLVSWAPVIFLVSYMCFVSIGLVPLPWVMTGEVFPASVRGIGSGSTSCFGFLFFFAVVKSGPALFSNLGSEGAFLVYGIIAAVGCIYLYVACPETKNKTLQDIENKFNEKSDSKG
jgi:facilitated trehalose transporter